MENTDKNNEMAVKNLVDQYFFLVDQAAHSGEKLDKLVDLFSEEGSITPAGAEPYAGQSAIRTQFTDFHKNVSTNSKHFYNITFNDGKQAKVDWAVAAKLNNESLFTLQGYNVFEINSNVQKIESLTIFNGTQD